GQPEKRTITERDHGEETEAVGRRSGPRRDEHRRRVAAHGRRGSTWLADASHGVAAGAQVRGESDRGDGGGGDRRRASGAWRIARGDRRGGDRLAWPSRPEGGDGDQHAESRVAELPVA